LRLATTFDNFHLLALKLAAAAAGPAQLVAVVTSFKGSK